MKSEPVWSKTWVTGTLNITPCIVLFKSHFSVNLSFNSRNLYYYSEFWILNMHLCFPEIRVTFVQTAKLGELLKSSQQNFMRVAVLH